MHPTTVFTHLTFLERSALAPPPGRVSVSCAVAPPKSQELDSSPAVDRPLEPRVRLVWSVGRLGVCERPGLACRQPTAEGPPRAGGGADRRGECGAEPWASPLHGSRGGWGASWAAHLPLSPGRAWVLGRGCMQAWAPLRGGRR